MENPVVHITNFLQPPSTELSHFLLNDNQLAVCNGVNPSYKKGVLIKDTGYTIIGSALEANKSITGLHNFRQSPTVQKMLATCNDATGADTELFYSTGGAWTEIPAAQTAWAGFEDCLVEMADFIGYCFFVGYDSTDNVFLPVGSLTNTTFSTATNVTSMAQGKYVTRYRDRLYVSNCYASATAYPYRTYFSSVPTAGVITWTPASDFFDVDFSEQITGQSQNWDRLVLFTEFSAYLYDQDNKGKAWDTGCVNHRTIQNQEAYMFWFNKDNGWVSTGGRPQAFGNDILELIRTSTDPSVWRSTIIDREYYIYLGSCSANGISYSNCVATYNIELGMWRWRELYNSMTMFAPYFTSSDDFLWMGTTLGTVMKKGKYVDSTKLYSDNGQPIVSHFRTKAYDLGDPSVRKSITKTIAYSEVAGGLELSFRIFDKYQEALQPFKPIGQLEQTIAIFNKKMTGYFIQFEGREYSTHAWWKFYGMSFQVSKETSL